jgi:hypothetical protein
MDEYGDEGEVGGGNKTAYHYFQKPWSGKIWMILLLSFDQDGSTFGEQYGICFDCTASLSYERQDDDVKALCFRSRSGLSAIPMQSRVKWKVNQNNLQRIRRPL